MRDEGRNSEEILRYNGKRFIVRILTIAEFSFDDFVEMGQNGGLKAIYHNESNA